VPFILDHDAIVTLYGCLPFWDRTCQPACGSERFSLETPHRSTATTIRFDRWYRTWWFSQVVRRQKRTSPFQSTLRQRPPGNRQLHKPIAQNTDWAILGDQNGRENLVHFFVVRVAHFLPHRGGVKSCVFSNVPCAGLAQMPRHWLLHYFCGQLIYSTTCVDSFRALYVLVGRWILSPLLVTHSIRYVLRSCTLTASGTVCLSSSNKVHYVQGALSFETLSGKNTTGPLLLPPYLVMCGNHHLLMGVQFADSFFSGF